MLCRMQMSIFLSQQLCSKTYHEITEIYWRTLCNDHQFCYQTPETDAWLAKLQVRALCSRLTVSGNTSNEYLWKGTLSKGTHDKGRCQTTIKKKNFYLLLNWGAQGHVFMVDCRRELLWVLRELQFVMLNTRMSQPTINSALPHTDPWKPEIFWYWDFIANWNWTTWGYSSADKNI